MSQEKQRTTVTRFAPSPTGGLHLGHAMAAIVAFDAATMSDGRFLVRIEDIDSGRARPEFEDAIFEDLEWLGLEWETPVRRQSEHMADYAKALARLDEMGLLYPCFCTRKEITAEIEQSQMAPHFINPHLINKGPDGPLYPGTCLGLDASAVQKKIAGGSPYALRLNMKKALAAAKKIGTPLVWRDINKGDVVAQPEIFGDVVLARKDIPTSYHLAVTLDDHLQGVTMVTRGEDLFLATHLHRLLQTLLSLNVPDYTHHRLIENEDGTRLSKREKSMTLRSLRVAGHKPSDIRKLLVEI